MNVVNAQWQRTARFGHPVGCTKFVATDSIIYGYNSTSLYKTIDNGLNWNKISISFEQINTVAVKNNIICVIYTTISTLTGNEFTNLITSNDKGLSWVNGSISISSDELNDIIVYNDTFYLSTGYGLYTSNNGINWNMYQSLNIGYNSVSVNGNKIFANTGHLEKSLDNGTTWTDINNNLPNHTYISSILSIANKLYIKLTSLDSLHYLDSIYVSNDDGGTWKLIQNGLLPDNSHNYSNFNVYNDTIYIHNLNNYFSTSVNDTVWKVFQLPFHGGYFAKNNINLIGDTYKGNYISQDYGNIWNYSSNGLDTTTSISSLNTNGNDIYATTQNEGIYKSNDRGQNWNSLNNAKIYNKDYYSLVFNDTLMFSIYNRDSIYKSNDNCQTWININNGINCSNIKNLAIIGINLYAITDCGLYLTTNFGQNWNLLSNGLPDTLINAIAFNGGNIYVETSLNGLFISNNNGSSWNSLNNTCNGDMLSVDGTHIVVSNGFCVLYSEDYGLNWDTIQPALPVQSILLYSNIIITIGTHHDYQNGTDGIYVYLSSDKGLSWYDFTSNLLINESAYCPFILNDTLYAIADYSTIWRRPLSDFTGIIENKSNNYQLSIYPNPTKENLTIETNANQEQRLEILNLIGQTVYTSIINKKAIINTSAFARGVYILKLSSDKETVVRKFVKE